MPRVVALARRVRPTPAGWGAATPRARPAPSGRDRSRCGFLQRIRQIGPAVARDSPPTALERAFGAPSRLGAIRGQLSCPTVDVRHQDRTEPHWRFPQRPSPAAPTARPRGLLATPPSRSSLASQPRCTVSHPTPQPATEPTNRDTGCLIPRSVGFRLGFRGDQVPRPRCPQGGRCATGVPPAGDRRSAWWWRRRPTAAGWGSGAAARAARPPALWPGTALWDSPMRRCPALWSNNDHRAGQRPRTAAEPAGADVRAPLTSGAGGDLPAIVGPISPLRCRNPQ